MIHIYYTSASGMPFDPARVTGKIYGKIFLTVEVDEHQQLKKLADEGQLPLTAELIVTEFDRQHFLAFPLKGDELHLDNGQRIKPGQLDKAVRPLNLFSRWYGFSLTFPKCEVYESKKS